jgi:type II secretory pathway component PulM
MEGWLERLLVAASGMTLILVVAYIVLVQDDHTMQAEVNQRQQFINQSIQLGRVDETLIRVLAANAGKDDKLRELLAQNGISINATTGAPERETPPPSPAPTAAPR